MESSSNMFTWLFGPRQTTAALAPSPCVPQSSSDSTTAPSHRGLVVSLELEQRGSEASGPAEAKRSSPSEEEKAHSDVAGGTRARESRGGEYEASDTGDRNESEKVEDLKEEDCAALINIKTAEVNLQENEGSKEKSGGQTEFKAAKLMVKEEEDSKENLLQDQWKVKETILEEKEECGEKPRQNELKVAEAEVKGKEISKEKPGQTECKPAKAKLKVKEYSEEDSGQSKCKAAKSKAPKKEEPLNLGKVECKVVKVNMKQNDDAKEEPGQTEFKAAKKNVKKKRESKEEPTQIKSKGSFGGVEAERSSTGAVEDGEIEVGGKQVEEEEEKDGRGGGEEKAVEEVQSKNAIWNEPEREGNEETCGGLKKGAQYPVRPDAEDCAFYMKTWTCKFGSNCKFNHSARKKVQAENQKMKEKEEESKEKLGQTKCKVKKEEVSKEKPGQTKCKVKKEEVSKEKPEQTKCKVKKEEVSKETAGQTKSKVKKEEVSKEKFGQTKSKAAKEKVKDKIDSTKNARQIECKFYFSPEGCKFGKACKFSHKKNNSVTPPVGLNFMGLPIRPGVKDCPYYVLTGACKSDANCKFNHPDPTPVVIDEPSVQDGHGECTSSQSAQHFPVWPSQGTSNESTPIVPMEYSATHPYTEWSPYEVPVNPVPHPPSPSYG